MNKQKKGGKSINDQKKQIISIKKQQETKINDLKKTSSQLQVDMDNFTKKIEQMKANDDKYQQQIINMER